MISRLTSLSANLVGFCRFLRSKGFLTGVEEASAALKALQWVKLETPQAFRLTLQTVLCKSKTEQQSFNELYDAYWKELAKGVDSKIKSKAAKEPKTIRDDAPFKALTSWINGNRNKEVEEVAAYSFHEKLSAKDFSTVPAEEIGELMLLIRRFSRRIALLLNRRYRQNARAGMPDIRRTLRKNIHAGGELVDLVFKQPKHNRVRVVLLCDVSKSMDLYAAFLLQFMYAFQQVYSRVQTFAFSTSLQNITAIMKHKVYQQTLRELSQLSDTWSGGTRIGESLQTFISAYPGQLSKQTIVIIVSDGWDTGPAGPMQAAMQTIQRKCRKVIWLNPLAGYSGYQPMAAGMQAALPYIDVFASVHNAESLQKLGRWL